MTVFTPTRQHNPCPICTDTSGKCRETSHIYLCMTMADALQQVPGFRFIGRTKDNLWGKWAAQNIHNAATAKSYSSHHHHHHGSVHRSPTLNADERDRLYNLLLNQLTLAPEDRDNLHKRGLTDEHITQWGIKSVDQWHKLTTIMASTLPGISHNGRSLNIPHAGYLCPIRDITGRIVACQIRSRSSQQGTPKYYWLTSKTKKNPHGATAHLEAGELPLTVCRPSNAYKQAIALVEGTGAKPYLTAEKQQTITIGAAGGQFASSPKTLTNILQTLTLDTQKAATEPCSKPIIEFYPDAGAISNPHVLRQYRSTWTLLQRLGFTVHIMWWNQITKESPDIDEHVEPDQIRAITIDEFETIARQPKLLLQQLSTLIGLEKNKTQKKRRLAEEKANCSKEMHSVHYYKKGKRLDAWKKAITHGYKYILDSSDTGTGKSFDTGTLDPSNLNSIQTVIYVSDQHRNPTVPTLESKNGWVDLEARHAGLTNERTPNGNSRIRRVRKGEKATIHANCSRTQTIQALQTKNISGIETASLVCGICPLKDTCTQLSGNGYGFLGQRRTALSVPKFRAHPDSLPDPNDYPYDSRLLVWDEPGQTIKIRKDIHVTLSDLQQAIAALLKNEAVFESVKPILSALIPYLDGSTSTGKFGIHHQQVIEIFPSLQEIDLPNVDSALTPNLDFLSTHPSFKTYPLSELDAIETNLSDTQIDEALATYADKKVPKPWLPALIQVLKKTWKGAVSIRNQILTISLLNSHHRACIQAASHTIFLDATLSRSDLALKVGCHKDEIYEVRQDKPNIQNLSILQVTDLGRMGMQRGNEQQRRVNELVRHYKAIDSTTKVIDFKKYSTDGAWWRDNRGVNDFVQTNTLILVGTPCRNIIDQASDYNLLTGNYHFESIEFQAYVNRVIQSDILQAIGRLRAHRRQHEKLQVIFVSNFEISLETKTKIASEITMKAATKKEQFIHMSINAFQTLKNRNEKITQVAVSKLTGYSQQYLSRHWKILLMLLEELNRKSSIFQSQCRPKNRHLLQHKYQSKIHLFKVSQTVREYIIKLANLPEKNWQWLSKYLNTYLQRKILLFMLSCS